MPIWTKQQEQNKNTNCTLIDLKKEIDKVNGILELRFSETAASIQNLSERLLESQVAVKRMYEIINNLSESINNLSESIPNSGFAVNLEDKFGETKLSRMLGEKRMTINDLSKKTGLGWTTISRIEKAAIPKSKIRKSTLFAMAHALNCKVSDII